MKLVTFRVQAQVSDRWATIEGAERLPQHEAHSLRAAEAAKVGEHRVQMVPNSGKAGARMSDKKCDAGDRHFHDDDVGEPGAPGTFSNNLPTTGESRCEICGEPAEELSQVIDQPGIIDAKTGNYRARWACDACAG